MSSSHISSIATSFSFSPRVSISSTPLFCGYNTRTVPSSQPMFLPPYYQRAVQLFTSYMADLPPYYQRAVQLFTSYMADLPPYYQRAVQLFTSYMADLPPYYQRAVQLFTSYMALFHVAE